MEFICGIVATAAKSHCVIVGQKRAITSKAVICSAHTGIENASVDTVLHTKGYRT